MRVLEESLPLLTAQPVETRRVSSTERRARSYTNAEFREVLVSNGTSNGHRTNNTLALEPTPAPLPVRPPFRCCDVSVVDFDSETFIDYGSKMSYSEAPMLTCKRARLVNVIQPTIEELNVIADKHELHELQMYGINAGDCMIPRVEVYDEHRIVIAVEVPSFNSTVSDTRSQTSTANPTAISAWTREKEPDYVPILMVADTTSNILVIVHTSDITGATSLTSRLVAILRNNVDDVRKHSVVHLISVASTFLVDRFYPVLEAESDLLDSVEAALLSDDQLALHRDIVRLIARTKRSMLGVRRRLWPFRRCLARLTLAPLRSDNTGDRYYTRALLDHVVHLLDVLELQRDAAHALLEVFLSAHNNRMQQVMEKMAVVTTIFLPLTFLTGLEGMNFKFMPELSGRYSYGVFICVVITIVWGMVSWFKRRGLL